MHHLRLLLNHLNGLGDFLTCHHPKQLKVIFNHRDHLDILPNHLVRDTGHRHMCLDSYGIFGHDPLQLNGFLLTLDVLSSYNPNQTLIIADRETFLARFFHQAIEVSYRITWR